jgi:hypothetical protein
MADETVIPFTPPAPSAPAAGVDPVPVVDPVPAEAAAPADNVSVDPAPVMTDPAPVSAAVTDPAPASGPQPHDAYYEAASAQPAAVDEETLRLQPPEPPIASDGSSLSFGQALKALANGHTIGRADIRLSPADVDLDDWRVF